MSLTEFLLTQDISEYVLQNIKPPYQFTFGKTLNVTSSSHKNRVYQAYMLLGNNGTAVTKKI